MVLVISRINSPDRLEGMRLWLPMEDEYLGPLTVLSIPSVMTIMKNKTDHIAEKRIVARPSG